MFPGSGALILVIGTILLFNSCNLQGSTLGYKANKNGKCQKIRSKSKN